MIKSTEVMRGDIIRLGNRAVEVKEVKDHSVIVKILNIGIGRLAQPWTKMQPYIITKDLLLALGFHQTEGYTDESYILERDDVLIAYRFDFGFLSALNRNPGEGFFYLEVKELHKLMQILRFYGFDCSFFYNRMRDYSIPGYVEL